MKWNLLIQLRTAVIFRSFTASNFAEAAQIAAQTAYDENGEVLQLSLQTA